MAAPPSRPRPPPRAWLADTLAGKESLLLVGTNDAAARVSAELRAQLVELGQVQEHGVRLGRAGWEDVTVGVGDVIQARRNAHHLVGYAGNTAMPVNRRCYRVTAIRPDGGLTVEPITRAGTDEDTAGVAPAAPLHLPAGYVAEHVSLGYATTVHSAQGRTVDTAHAVVGATTNAAGAYVALTRGRERNTAYTVTRSLAPDSKTGQTFEVHERTARAVLHDVLDTADADRTATAQREAARLDAISTMTHIDRLIDGVAQATAGRTATALDRLATDGRLTPAQRAALATDDAAGSLDRLLRLAELAGHDPEQVLTAAVTARDLHGARYPAQVLHGRITTALTGRLTPRISSAHDLIPAEVAPSWTAWLHDHADAADARRHELGAQLAADPPAWAVAALGPVPQGDTDTVNARQDWEERAGWAAGWRELAGHNDPADTADPAAVHMPLGPAPAAGLAEKRALFRTAHNALGLVDAGDEEAGMTDGQLRARVYGYEREKTWAPRDVTDDLNQTHRAAEQARADATLWAARAERTSDPAEQSRLRTAAHDAALRAENLDEQIRRLEPADEIRALWFTHTAVSRDLADRSRSELRSRGVDLDHPGDRVTAEEWLDTHLIDQLADDADREIRDEHDLHDNQYELDVRSGMEPAAGRRHDMHPETAAADVRDTSTAHPSEHHDTARRGRVPTVDESAAAVARAQLALVEIANRQAIESAREADETALRDELNRDSPHDDHTRSDVDKNIRHQHDDDRSRDAELIHD